MSEISASFIVISVILTTIVVGTIVGNFFVIIAILIDKNLQTTANQLVLSLAVADLMVACLVMPLGAYNDIHQGWYLGKEVCEFWTSADVLCCTASILNLLAIALDRYWAVTNVDYIYRRTRRRVNIMVLCAWTVGAVVSLAPIFGWKDPDFANRVLVEHKCMVSQDVAYQIFATISTFYAPLVLLLALYWRIFQVARKRIRRKPGQNNTDTTTANNNQALALTCGGPTTNRANLTSNKEAPNSKRLSLKVAECGKQPRNNLAACVRCEGPTQATTTTDEGESCKLVDGNNIVAAQVNDDANSNYGNNLRASADTTITQFQSRKWVGQRSSSDKLPQQMHSAGTTQDDCGGLEIVHRDQVGVNKSSCHKFHANQKSLAGVANIGTKPAIVEQRQWRITSISEHERTRAEPGRGGGGGGGRVENTESDDNHERQQMIGAEVVEAQAPSERHTNEINRLLSSRSPQQQTSPIFGGRETSFAVLENTSGEQGAATFGENNEPTRRRNFAAFTNDGSSCSCPADSSSSALIGAMNRQAGGGAAKMTKMTTAATIMTIAAKGMKKLSAAAPLSSCSTDQRQQEEQRMDQDNKNNEQTVQLESSLLSSSKAAPTNGQNRGNRRSLSRGKVVPVDRSAEEAAENDQLLVSRQRDEEEEEEEEEKAEEEMDKGEAKQNNNNKISSSGRRFSSVDAVSGGEESEECSQLLLSCSRLLSGSTSGDLCCGCCCDTSQFCAQVYTTIATATTSQESASTCCLHCDKLLLLNDASAQTTTPADGSKLSSTGLVLQRRPLSETGATTTATTSKQQPVAAKDDDDDSARDAQDTNLAQINHGLVDHDEQHSAYFKHRQISSAISLDKNNKDKDGSNKELGSTLDSCSTAARATGAVSQLLRNDEARRSSSLEIDHKQHEPPQPAEYFACGVQHHRQLSGISSPSNSSSMKIDDHARENELEASIKSCSSDEYMIESVDDFDQQHGETAANNGEPKRATHFCHLKDTRSTVSATPEEEHLHHKHHYYQHLHRHHYHEHHEHLDDELSDASSLSGPFPPPIEQQRSRDNHQCCASAALHLLAQPEPGKELLRDSAIVIGKTAATWPAKHEHEQNQPNQQAKLSELVERHNLKVAERKYNGISSLAAQHGDKLLSPVQSQRIHSNNTCLATATLEGSDHFQVVGKGVLEVGSSSNSASRSVASSVGQQLNRQLESVDGITAMSTGNAVNTTTTVTAPTTTTIGGAKSSDQQRTMRSLDIKRKFRALGQLVSFVQTSRNFNSSSWSVHSSQQTTPSGPSSGDMDVEERGGRFRGLVNIAGQTGRTCDGSDGDDDLEEDDDDDEDDDDEGNEDEGDERDKKLSCYQTHTMEGVVDYGGRHINNNQAASGQRGHERRVSGSGGQRRPSSGQPHQRNQVVQVSTIETTAALTTTKIPTSAVSSRHIQHSPSGKLHERQQTFDRQNRGGSTRARRQAAGGNTTGMGSKRRQNMDIRREKKAAKTLAIITGVFVCCWLPFFLNAIIMPICGPSCTPSDLILSILLWLGYLNSLLNPIIYTIFSPDFRRAFRRLLCWPQLISLSTRFTKSATTIKVAE